METAPRHPMANARYIRLVSFVASQSRIVSAAITQNATVLAIPRTSTTVPVVTTIELDRRQLIAGPGVGID